MTYNHTAADALALAATCEKRVSAGTGVALNAAEAYMVAKALRFLAEHRKIEVGNRLVDKFGKNKEILLVRTIGRYGEIYDKYGFLVVPSQVRLATPAEIEAGHRIDEVQNEL